ncbi:tetratricopeptide repeat protein [Streptomyces sp. NPDC054871]
MAALEVWRDDPDSRLSARWLYGPGGQGKTRLATHLAALSAAAGWKVVVATDGPGAVHPPPGSQDLRTESAAGLLVLVDYADRWPGSHLRWLFSNTLFHQPGVRTRILLIGRTADVWPALRAGLANSGASTTSHYLEGLPADDLRQRGEMLRAARAGFAALFGLAAPTAAAQSVPLSHPDYGLTLTLHMAALVEVDARMRGRHAPMDMAGLTLYLLDREHAHWELMFGDGTHQLTPRGATFRTPPSVMNRLVFTASLTGSMERATGEATLAALGFEASPEQACRDHAHCYPAADPSGATVLEPLYPDRLAEDFLALTVMGHRADYPGQAWAAPLASLLLSRPEAGHPPPAWTPRAITFLASAADRWPHLGPACLYPLLWDDPALAVAAGSAGLSALAAIGDVAPDLLASIKDQAPARRDVDLDTGMAAVTLRVARNIAAGSDDRALHADAWFDAASRLYWAGQPQQSVDGFREAVAAYRIAVVDSPGVHDRDFALALADLASALTLSGRREEALAPAEEAVAVMRRQALDGLPASLQGLAVALNSLGTQHAQLGQLAAAVDVTCEAVALMRGQADDYTARKFLLAGALSNLMNWLGKRGDHAAALAAIRESTLIRRELAADSPQAYTPDLAEALVNLAVQLVGARQADEALRVGEEAVALCRRLCERNATAFEGHLARALSIASYPLSEAGRTDEALSAGQEAVAILTRLTATDPVTYEDQLANTQLLLSWQYSAHGRHQQAQESAEAAVATYRRLMDANPGAYVRSCANALSEYGLRLLAAGFPRDALASTEEALELVLPWATREPGSWLGFLVVTQARRSAQLSRVGLREEAIEAGREAVALARKAAEEHAGTPHDLMGALLNLSTRLAEAGRSKESRAARKESAKVARQYKRS